MFLDADGQVGPDESGFRFAQDFALLKIYADCFLSAWCT